MNKDALKFYMPNYPSTDDACKDNACGYIVITNIDINTHNNLKRDKYLNIKRILLFNDKNILLLFLGSKS